jgi:hypothetical protein
MWVLKGVHAKTRRREEAGVGRKAPYFVDPRFGGSVEREGRFAANASSSRLRVFA